jgi:spartin
MTVTPEAFALLVLPNITLTTGQPPHAHAQTGVLALECVTVPHPGGTTGSERDVYLVLRLNTSETPLDPERIVQRVDKPAAREYIFHGTANDAEEVRVNFPITGSTPPGYMEDLDTFESIIGQYHGDVRTGNPADPFADSKFGAGRPVPPPPTQKGPPPLSMGNVSVGGVAKGDADLRGHLVMIDESTGEIVGQVEDRLRIHEDPMMHTRGHENDPVVIEVAEQSPEDEDANALEAFARYIPPEEQNWVTKGASVVR